MDPEGTGVWPLSPTPHVVLGFDPPDSAWGAGHRGVDLDGQPGQLVSTALDGQVLWAGRLAGRGVVVIGHGPTRTTYEPVTAHVRVGDLVSAGDVIGALELVGSHCLPRACLHWGWLRGTTYLNPLDLVGAIRIRLLPPDGVPRPSRLPVHDAWVALDQLAQLRLAFRFATGFW
jgi:murein DD-endopeptidase MepM/ murein hydrolase activator NlpD